MILLTCVYWKYETTKATLWKQSVTASLVNNLYLPIPLQLTNSHVHVCGTYCLKSLEEAVEEKVPDDFAILKGRNIPYEEIGKHSQRG